MWSRVARGKAPLRQAFQRIDISGETRKVNSSAGIEGGGEGRSFLVGCTHCVKARLKQSKPGYARLCCSDKQPRILSGFKQQRITSRSCCMSIMGLLGARSICSVSGQQGRGKGPTQSCTGSSRLPPEVTQVPWLCIPTACPKESWRRWGRTRMRAQQVWVLVSSSETRLERKRLGQSRVLILWSVVCSEASCTILCVCVGGCCTHVYVTWVRVHSLFQALKGFQVPINPQKTE